MLDTEDSEELFAQTHLRARPDTFDTSQKTIKEIVGATCQAEVVHEIIMALSLLPIAFIPLLGGAAALVITSVWAMPFTFTPNAAAALQAMRSWICRKLT